MAAAPNSEISKPRKKFSPTRSRLPLLLLGILLIYFTVSFVMQTSRLWTLQHSVAQMQSRVEDLQKKNDGLWQRVQTLESDGYIEQTARERLGLVKPGETRVIPVAPGQESSAETSTAAPRDAVPLDTSIRD